MQDYSLVKDKNFYNSYRFLINETDTLSYEDKIYLNALLDVMSCKVESVFAEFEKRRRK